MKRSLILVAAILIAFAAAQARGKSAVADKPQAQPRVEVAFVIDTTGSMSGLIQAAKEKIWFIANQIVLGKPRPIVRIALVPYRDKGDAYVTKVYDLTDNIDQVYTDLMGFKAAGGGDGPENVNQALYDAVNKLKWSHYRKTLKIIFLVGDWPPHNEYKDVPTYDKIAKSAIEKGIYVNTILCGSNAAARKVWIEIAERAEGTFAAIAQSGGVRTVATPFDKDLAKLNAKLTTTAVFYGDKKTQARYGMLNTAAAKYAPGASADRAVFAAESGIAAAGDLVDAVRNKKADLDEIKTEHLPQNMQKMSAEERSKYIKTQQAKRDEITKKIKALSAKRATYVKKELAKAPAGKKGFDHKVVEALHEQAARKGITYEE